MANNIKSGNLWASQRLIYKELICEGSGENEENHTKTTCPIKQNAPIANNHNVYKTWKKDVKNQI